MQVECRLVRCGEQRQPAMSTRNRDCGRDSILRCKPSRRQGDVLDEGGRLICSAVPGR
jgi:hypothetical protein